MATATQPTVVTHSFTTPLVFTTPPTDIKLFSNTGGSFPNGSLNVAIGYLALANNITAFGNTANGYKAFNNNTLGLDNVALGYPAGINITTGNHNIDIGNSGDPDSVQHHPHRLDLNPLKNLYRGH